MKASGLGWLVLLWAVSRARSASASSAPAPGSPPPSSPRAPATYGSALPLPAHGGTEWSDDYLLNPPTTPQPEDELWSRYIHDPSRPGPRVIADESAVARKLTDFERWALGPYFIADDLEVEVYNGAAPPGFDQSKVDQIPKSLWAVTLAKPSGGALIWLPRLQHLWERWWLSLLAHEMTHAAQVRMGGQSQEELAKQMQRYGYEGSPTEVQARWMQGRVLNGLDARARAFYAKR